MEVVGVGVHKLLMLTWMSFAGALNALKWNENFWYIFTGTSGWEHTQVSSNS